MFTINKKIEKYKNCDILYTYFSSEEVVLLYKQCRTEQSASRQRQLMEGLLEAMIQQHYDEITVSSLCDQMQVPRKSFYRYVSSKEGALHALIDHALLDFESFTTEHSHRTASVQEEMEQCFAYWLHKKKLLDALAKSGLSGVLVNRAIGHSVFEAMSGRRFLPVEEQQAQEYITLFFVSGFMSMVIQWHHEGYPQSVQQMAQIAIRLVSQPMAPGLFNK